MPYEDGSPTPEEQAAQEPTAGGGDWWTNNQPKVTAAAGTGWDPAKFAQIVGRPPTPEETAFYSQAPDWQAQVTANTPAADRNRNAAPPSGAGSSGGGQGWINQTLGEVQSTDDPGYWAGVIAKDPKAMAGDPSAIAYWQDRIRRGDGSVLVKTGQLTRVNDSPSGGTGNWQTGQGVTPTEMASYGVPGSPFQSQAYGSSYQAPAIPAGLAAPFVPPTAPGVLATQYALPTQAELEATPGYAARLAAGLQGRERSAAAHGSILNGGTQKGLERFGQDYASNEYNNLVGQSLAARAANQGEFQANVLQPSFAARGLNQNEFQQNVVQPGQVAYQNQYRQYLDDQQRQLNDYLTNYNINRTGVQDFLTQQNRTADRGLQATYYGRPS